MAAAGEFAEDGFFVVRLSGASGLEQCRFQLPGTPLLFPGGGGQAVAIDGTNVVAAGAAPGTQVPNFYVVKLSSACTLLWQYRLMDGLAEVFANARAVAVDEAGDVFAGGSGFVVKLDGASGAELWRRQGLSSFEALQLDSAGDVFASSPLVKLDGETGNVLCSGGAARDIVLDAGEDVLSDRGKADGATCTDLALANLASFNAIVVGTDGIDLAVGGSSSSAFSVVKLLPEPSSPFLALPALPIVVMLARARRPPREGASPVTHVDEASS